MGNLAQAIANTHLLGEAAAVFGFVLLIALVRRTVGGQNRRSS